jgi:predicted nucleic acid-binding protein
MPGRRPLYYWDTCLFLAWIQDEQRPSGEMAGVREIIARAKRREVLIMTSVLTTTEALQSKIPAGVETLFTSLMQRVERKSIDIKIARLAHDLRDYYVNRSAQSDGKTLSTPDALHVATAIMYRADELHTFDGNGSRKSLGLLPLSGDVGGHALVICKPVAQHPELDLVGGKK